MYILCIYLYILLIIISVTIFSIGGVVVPVASGGAVLSAGAASSCGAVCCSCAPVATDAAAACRLSAWRCKTAPELNKKNYIRSKEINSDHPCALYRSWSRHGSRTPRFNVGVLRRDTYTEEKWFPWSVVVEATGGTDECVVSHVPPSSMLRGR